MQKNNMQFRIVNESGAGVMSCNSVSCVPSYEILKVMHSAGYRFTLNGKYATPKRIKEFVDEYKE